MKKPEWMDYVLDSVWSELSDEEKNELYREGLEQGWDGEEIVVVYESEVCEVCEGGPVGFDWEEWLNGERKMDECPVFMMPEWVSEIVYGKEV